MGTRGLGYDLLEHFFGVPEDDVDSPVVRLLVTPEELMTVVGERGAPDTVRNHFVGLLPRRAGITAIIVVIAFAIIAAQLLVALVESFIGSARSRSFTLWAGSLVFVFLTWHIPSVAGSMMAGAVSLSLADAIYPATWGSRAAGAGLIAASASAARRYPLGDGVSTTCAFTHRYTLETAG